MSRHVWMLLAVGLMLSCKGGDPSSDLSKSGPPVAILVAPADAVVPLGDELSLVATGVWEDRTTADVTAAGTWSSSSDGVVSVSNDLDAEGVVSGVAVGAATVYVEFEGILSPSVVVTVTDATLLEISVDPATASLEIDDSLQLEAVATYSDGTRADASSQVRWIIGDGDVAQVETSGLLTGVGEGTTQVYASWNDIESEPTEITVTDGGQVDLSTAIEAESGEDTLTLAVTVDNDGTLGASGFWVDVFVDPSSEPEVGDYGDDYVYVSYVDAGDSEELSFLVSVEDEGEHTVYALVDSTGAVDESDETNNTASTSVSTDSTEEGLANLSVSYFSWSSGDTDGDGYDDYIYYMVDVDNTGTEDAVGFYVDLYVDLYDSPDLYDTSDDYLYIESIASGETAYADFIVYDTCSYCWSWVLVDSADYIEETNELDNVDGPLTVSTW